MGATTPSPKGTRSPKTTLKSSSPQNIVKQTVSSSTTPINKATTSPSNLYNKNDNAHKLSSNGILNNKPIQKTQANAKQISRTEKNGILQGVDASTSANIDSIELIEANKKVEAFSVLIQYLAFHVSNF